MASHTYEELLDMVKRIYYVECKAKERVALLEHLSKELGEPYLSDAIYWPNEFRKRDPEFPREEDPKALLDYFLARGPCLPIPLPVSSIDKH